MTAQTPNILLFIADGLRAQSLDPDLQVVAPHIRNLADRGFDFDELYNLDQDPAEMHNLASAPEQSERIRYMMGRIWEHLEATADRALVNTHYYSMRFACVGPNFTPAKAATGPDATGN